MNAQMKIGELQAGMKKGSHAWCIGEQLKEICRREPESSRLVEQDLENKEMGLEACARKFEEWAAKNREGNRACITQWQAEKLIREFYGLPEPAAEETRSRLVDLLDYL